MNLRNTPIAVLLISILALVTTLLLGLFAAIAYQSEKEALWTGLRDAVAVESDQLATGLLLPVWDIDEQQTLNIMKSSMRHPAIHTVVTRVGQQSTVATRNSQWEIVSAIAAPEPDAFVIAEREIRRDGRVLGSVQVFGSPKLIEEELAARRQTIFFGILLLDLTLVLSLYALLSKMILNPLRAIEGYAKEVTEKGTITRRSDVTFIGELKSLEGSIRTMVGLLEERYQALRESEAKFKSIIDVSPVPLILHSDEQTIVYLNKAFVRTLGYTVDDIPTVAEWWIKAYPDPEYREWARKSWPAYLSQLEQQISDVPPLEGRVCCKDGTVRTFLFSAAPLGDSVTGMHLAVLQDITQRKRAELELRELNASLEKRVELRTEELLVAKTAAEAATRAKSEFLANMSHEIRTPMNAILGMTDLALRGDLSSKQKDYLLKARSAAKSLLGIIDDILDFSKIEAGKLEMEQTEFLLDDVLDKVTSIVGLKAQEKGLEFLLNTAPDVPQALIGDPLRLRQVLINLCNNAIKFTDSGEIVVVAVKQLTLADGRTTLYFSVRDTGIGMSDEQIARLFQPFSQADASSTRKYGGTGLGLAICRQLVTLMGGEIGARSQLGIGSDFFFTAKFGLGNPASVPVLHAAPELSALRILVIDDSPNAREIFQGLLATFGYHATLTDSAAAGIAALETADPPYDLVLLDWKMPGMDGFEAAGLIRRHPKLAVQPKLVMVTAYGSDDAQRRVLAEGLDGYLTKPVNASSLLDEIMRVCGKSAVSTNLGRNNAPEQDHLANIRGLRVLLVEDNDFNQQVAKEILTGVAGVEVSIAWNGQEALEILQAQSFDAVLMDLQMPVMDGYETTEQLRRNPRFAALPIIAMTAHAMARDRERCLAAGMNDFISKPFDPAELFAVLARATASRVPATAATPHQPVATPVVPALAGISPENGLKHSFGKHELWEKWLKVFFDTRRSSHQEIHAALAAGDVAAASTIAHAIKANAGTIGADQLSEAAMALQLALDAGESEQWAPLLANYERELEHVIGGLTTYFSDR